MRNKIWAKWVMLLLMGLALGAQGGQNTTGPPLSKWGQIKAIMYRDSLEFGEIISKAGTEIKWELQNGTRDILEVYYEEEEKVENRSMGGPQFRGGPHLGGFRSLHQAVTGENCDEAAPLPSDPNKVHGFLSGFLGRLRSTELYEEMQNMLQEGTGSDHFKTAFKVLHSIDEMIHPMNDTLTLDAENRDSGIIATMDWICNTTTSSTTTSTTPYIITSTSTSESTTAASTTSSSTTEITESKMERALRIVVRVGKAILAIILRALGEVKRLLLRFGKEVISVFSGGSAEMTEEAIDDLEYLYRKGYMQPYRIIQFITDTKYGKYAPLVLLLAQKSSISNHLGHYFSGGNTTIEGREPSEDESAPNFLASAMTMLSSYGETKDGKTKEKLQDGLDSISSLLSLNGAEGVGTDKVNDVMNMLKSAATGGSEQGEKHAGLDGISTMLKLAMADGVADQQSHSALHTLTSLLKLADGDVDDKTQSGLNALSYVLNLAGQEHGEAAPSSGTGDLVKSVLLGALGSYQGGKAQEESSTGLDSVATLLKLANAGRDDTHTHMNTLVKLLRLNDHASSGSSLTPKEKAEEVAIASLELLAEGLEGAHSSLRSYRRSIQGNRTFELDPNCTLCQLDDEEIQGNMNAAIEMAQEVIDASDAVDSWRASLPEPRDDSNTRNVRSGANILLKKAKVFRSAAEAAVDQKRSKQEATTTAAATESTAKEGGGETTATATTTTTMDLSKAVDEDDGIRRVKKAIVTVFFKIFYELLKHLCNYLEGVEYPTY